MAVVKSDIVTTADDLDTQNVSGIYGAPIQASFVYTAAGAIADNTVILLCEIPVDAIISSIKWSSDDLGTTGTFNLGLYPGRGSGTTIAADTDAVDEDCLATAIDVNAAALADVEVRFEVDDHADRNDRAWEIAGLTSRPDYSTFYLCATAAAATTAAGDISGLVTYRI